MSTESSTEGEPEPVRIDENWTKKTEKLAIEWKDLAHKACEGHRKAGFSNKFKHNVTGVPVIVLSAIFAPLTATLGSCESYTKYISMVGFILTGILSGINGFYGFVQKHQRHMDYSGRYGEIVTDVQYELAKGRQFRTPPDQFLMKIQVKMDHLNSEAPDL